MIVLQAMALAALLGLGALVSAFEAAVTALSALRMKRLVVISPRLAPFLKEWLSHPHRLLSFLMVANNAASVGFSSLAAVAAVPVYRVLPSALVDWMVWIAASLILVVVGEVVPKIVGRVYRERVTEWALPIFSRVTRAFFLVWGPVGWIVEKFSPALATPPVGALNEVSLEELQHAAEESRATGHLTRDAADMFARALSLSRKTAVDIAQPADRVDALPLELLDRPRGAVLLEDLLVETGRTRVPVTRGGRAVGYVNALDLLREDRSAGFVDVIRPLRRVLPTARAVDLLEEFRRTGDPVALVESADGRPVGLLTMEDILEEIVGEILDEYDREESEGPRS